MQRLSCNEKEKYLKKINQPLVNIILDIVTHKGKGFLVLLEVVSHG